jgi:Xaa-Pro aminopeptidase
MIIEGLSVIKDEQEMLQEKEAIRLAEKVFQSHILPKIERKLSRGKKVTTLDLAAIIASYGVKHSAENFLSIILINEHSCHPHGKTGDKNWRSTIEQGDIIVFNWGYSVGGNCSDITRAMMIGKPKTKEQKDFEGAYKLMIEAKKVLMSTIKDGVHSKEIWKIATKMVETAGYPKNSLNITGHGIGIQIHNYPLVSRDHLTAGQLLSVEPGLNLPGIGHARVGGQVLVTNDGCEDLSSLSEELVII